MYSLCSNLLCVHTHTQTHAILTRIYRIVTHQIKEKNYKFKTHKLKKFNIYFIIRLFALQLEFAASRYDRVDASLTTEPLRCRRGCFVVDRWRSNTVVQDFLI